MADTKQITIRLEPTVIARADALTDYMTRELGVTAPRATVLRVALLRGLAELERERKAKGL